VVAVVGDLPRLWLRGQPELPRTPAGAYVSADLSAELRFATGRLPIRGYEQVDGVGLRHVLRDARWEATVMVTAPPVGAVGECWISVDHAGAVARVASFVPAHFGTGISELIVKPAASSDGTIPPPSRRSSVGTGLVAGGIGALCIGLVGRLRRPSLAVFRLLALDRRGHALVVYLPVLVVTVVAVGVTSAVLVGRAAIGAQPTRGVVGAAALTTLAASVALTLLGPACVWVANGGGLWRMLRDQ